MLDLRSYLSAVVWINQFPGDHRDVEPPESISNSEVKSVIADGSVGFPHVRVGHHQVIILKKPSNLLGFFLFWKRLTNYKLSALEKGVEPQVR